jgi:hypothetical protein
MATTLTSLASITLTASLVNTINTLGTATAALSKGYGSAFTDGTGAGTANRVWWATRTLTASSTEDLDLAGSLTDAYGSTITFARIKALVVAASAANTNNVIVGNAASNAVAGLFGSLTHTAVVRPGAAVAWMCGAADATGYVVTAGTADIIKIANSAGSTSVDYDIFVLGNAT